MNGLLWLDMFFGFMFAMVITVPRKAIRQYIMVAFLSGFGQGIIVTALLAHGLGLWKFNYVDIFNLDGIPVFIVFAWIPVVIIYSFYFNRVRKPSEIFAYMMAYSLATALFVHWMLRAGFLIFIKWNSLFTVILAFLLYSPLTYMLLKMRSIEENIGEG